MQLRFKSGKPIPENVMEALIYIGKVGVLTRPTWKRHFARGNDRWARRQLHDLEHRAVFKKHSCHHQEDTWVLSDWSKALLESNQFSCVSPVPPHLIEHDEVVGNGLLTLKKIGECSKWMTERELKGLNVESFAIENKGKDKKYPDAIFRVPAAPDLTFALEYERTGKSICRYRSIIRRYSRIQDFARILYLCEDDSIKSRIKSAMAYVGDRSLNDRVGFVYSAQWRNHPERVWVECRGKILSLSEFLMVRKLEPLF